MPASIYSFVLMGVRRKITECSGVFFITFTCARWLPLFELTNGYGAVCWWFEYLREQKHHIVGYVIIPSHVHVLIAFSETRNCINAIIGNGKRFMAYDLVKRLQKQGKTHILEQLAGWVNKTQQLENKKHEVFEPSFDRKECFTISFMKQKTDYMHKNPCKAGMVSLPEDYTPSSVRYYYTGIQGIYPVINLYGVTGY